jgi:hypothetical protein
MFNRPAAKIITLAALFQLCSAVGVPAPSQEQQQQPATTSSQQSPPMPPKIHFVDIAAQAGLTARTEFGGDHIKKYIIESTGTGAAVIDYDNDGWPDIFLVNGSTLEGFPKGHEPASHLYHNNRDGTFSDVTQKAGVALVGWGQGVCAGDYDNDGFTDLFVTFWGHNVLLHNNGDGSFTDVTKKSGLAHADVRWNTGCSFVDYDRDGHLDLFIARYVDFDAAQLHDPATASACDWKGQPVFCGPMGLKGARNELYHNNGDGTFTDVSEKLILKDHVPHYCFTPLTADFENNGWPDIYVSCDSSPNLLFHNNRDGSFTDIALSAGVAYNEDGHTQAGMGVDAGDYEGDGWLDIIKTNFSDDSSTLYRNNHDGSFTDATLQAGLGGNVEFLGWGALFVDVDNDGWPDIFVVNGHVYPEIDGKGLLSSFRERKLVYWNEHNGKFKDVSLDAGPAITKPFNSHGLAAADFRNDGNVELLVNNSYDGPSLLKNDAPQGNWLTIKLIGTKSNRDAIGARVALRVDGHQQIQEVRSGGSYISQSDFRLHFGLGRATEFDSLQIRWPSGLHEELKNIPVNKVITIKEGVGIVVHP